MGAYIKEQGSTKVLMVNDKPFVMLAGEVHNSNSSSVKVMEGVWDKALALGMNALCLPVTWEMIEPWEGCFDFRIVDGLIAQAREKGGKINFLWFGAWKNAECMYAPSWVKTDLERFRRAEVVKGENRSSIGNMGGHGRPYSTLSAFCANTLEADCRAFHRLMEHIKEVDELETTVVCVQVENETGLLGAARDHSDAADEAFAAPVPVEFISYMKSHTASMAPDVKEAVEQGAEEGSWAEVFGPVADEVFQTFYTASYCNAVAEAGKQAYDLPMSCNCWLNKAADKPGDYPCGGPVARMHEVWDFCAPAIDVYAPDIYVPTFIQVCEEYRKNGNPLFIPECATHSYAAPRMVYCVGHHHAMCYSPFGFEEMGEPFNAMQGFLFGMDVNDPALKTPQSVAEYKAYADALKNMMPLITEHYGSPTLQATCAEDKEHKMVTFGSIGALTIFDMPMLDKKNGVVLSVQTEDNGGYMLVGHAMLAFTSLDPEKPHVDILDMEAGHFENGEWVMDIRLNGDETAFLKFEEPTILRYRGFNYK